MSNLLLSAPFGKPRQSHDLPCSFFKGQSSSSKTETTLIYMTPLKTDSDAPNKSRSLPVRETRKGVAQQKTSRAYSLPGFFSSGSRRGRILSRSLFSLFKPTLIWGVL